MPRRTAAIEPRLITASQAAVLVGCESARDFEREVEAGLWPAPHPKTLQRRKPCWDRALLNKAIDKDSRLGDLVAHDRDELDEGLGLEQNPAPETLQH